MSTRLYKNTKGIWVGYIGTRRVMEFGTDEQAARDWQYDQMNPRQTYGFVTNPMTGETAPDGQVWCKNAMTGTWFLQSDRTPFTASPASESYWSS